MANTWPKQSQGKTNEVKPQYEEQILNSYQIRHETCVVQCMRGYRGSSTTSTVTQMANNNSTLESKAQRLSWKSRLSEGFSGTTSQSASQPTTVANTRMRGEGITRSPHTQYPKSYFQNPPPMLNTLSSVSVREYRIQYLCDPQWFMDTASRITDSACKNQLVVVSVQYCPFNPYIPIRSTTIGKSRVAKDPIAMHTSWRSNSDIASVTSIGYPRMYASGESSTTMHRLLHASGSHPIPPPKTASESANGSK
ncbi:ABC transporter B family member 13-like [Dorcoceras hygrometricum]|uniref:ABC transporter B family member 13-like n=1 Tax=Dorcoceras hygrometricum TaxID=472368 RepID=A0A2Z7BQH8_9LAMI|nr:ABC transporter B family member 13-like [Dorcoceras hygrometricum]